MSSIRSLARGVAMSVAAASALTLAVAGSALAMPATSDCACGGARMAVHSRLPTSGTDVAAPDQQNPLRWEARPVIRRPTDGARHATLTPTPTTTIDSRFQWGDAGIGAAGAVAILLAGFGTALVIRRRRLPHPAPPA